jgi:membrane protein required for colicin V production
MNTATTALNAVDYFVLFIFGMSILAGYMRGLVKELVALITWVVATAVSTLFAGKLAAAFSGTSGSTAQAGLTSAGVSGIDISHPMSMLAIGASFVTLFIATMVIGYIVSTLITGLAAGVSASLSNRFFGALFGLCRGFLIVIILMFLAELTPMGSQPAWGQSQFVKSFQPVVSWIEQLVHPGLEDILKRTESAVQGVSGGAAGVSGVLGNFTGGGQ